MPVLVTGAAGFLGRHVVAALRHRGVDVVGLVRHPSTLACPTVVADLRDARAVAAAMTEVRPSTVLHLAWYTHPGTFWHAEENLEALALTCQLAQAATKAGCTRFVGAGTVAEYRWDTPRLAEDSPREPATLYGWTKKAAYEVLSAFLAPHSAFAWMRYGWMFGPGEPSGKLVSSLGAGLLAGRDVPCSTGSVSRDYLYVEDVADATAAVTLSPVVGGINVGSGVGTRVAHLFDQIEQAVGRGRVLRGALPDDHPPELVLDVGRLSNEVGWTPRWSLEAGIQRTIDVLR